MGDAVKKYNGFLLATTGGFAAMSGAQAADLPVKARVAPPVASWEGWYIGLHAGAAWQRAGADYTGTVGEVANGAALAPIVHSNKHTGFIGGGQVGYNWQRGMYVFGLEGDISELTGKVTAPPLRSPATKGNAFEGKINWLSTLRGRAGWLVRSDTLVYATGGLAVGGVKDDFKPNGLTSSTNPNNTQKSASKTKVGWTVGGGIEFMFARNWTLGLEGLYVDLGKTDGTTSRANTKTSSFRNTAAIARAKLNYKF